MNTTSTPVKDPEYWRTINPELNITLEGSQRAMPALPLDIAFRDPKWHSHVVDEGYLQFDKVVPDADVKKLRSGIENLLQNSWMPLFAFLYDEYWDFYQSLTELLVPVLGDKPKMLPDFWIWCVDPSKKEAGWSSHREDLIDTLLDDGMPKSATVWVSLSDSTPLNGCMYIVPANQDRDYRNFTPKKQPLIPETVRALPAPAGTVFLWNHRVFHWGSVSSDRADSPRISMAFEFQRDDIKPYRTPLTAIDHLPSFEERLNLIGIQMLQYQHLYECTDAMKEIAEEMTS